MEISALNATQSIDLNKSIPVEPSGEMNNRMERSPQNSLHPSRMDLTFRISIYNPRLFVIYWFAFASYDQKRFNFARIPFIQNSAVSTATALHKTAIRTRELASFFNGIYSIIHFSSDCLVHRVLIATIKVLFMSIH